MTALVHQDQASALEGAADLATIIKTIADRKVVSAPEKPSKPALPVPVKEETIEAISRLSDQLKSVAVPSELRRLTQTEQAELIKMGSDAKLVDKTIDTAVALVKGAFFRHLDAGLMAENDTSELPRDDKGFFLVAGEQEVEGTGLKATRELRQQAPQINAAGLKKLWADKVISRETYYKLTKAVEVPREVDEEALLAYLSDSKNHSKIAPAIVPGTVTASFWIKPVKAE